MKNLSLFVFCLISTWAMAQEKSTMNYTIDATQNLDTFTVSLTLSAPLSKETKIYQFAATAPGTYQTMNIGRYVSDFKAFDKKGKEISVSKLSVNQFSIAKPEKVTKIAYKIAETFDTKVKEFPVYLMCGSSIEADHVLINAHTLFGYFEGYQKNPLTINVIANPAWTVGTALKQQNKSFVADNFDHAVDSPILMGNLSFADTTIAKTKVSIYTYSKSGKIGSNELLNGMSDMLSATLKFLVDLPVEEYTFLYFFEPSPPGITGAWEHSFSSEYVITEGEPTAEYMEKVTDIASHEFFHIVTPLNIHSEIIESFNFVSPTPSVHLWMYEGVTEWASNILMYRGGVIDEETFFKGSITTKIYIAEHYFDTSWSLKKLSEESFNGGEGAKQYGNIYSKGALVAGLLDIKLLELSDGKYGLRELILELIKKYGKGKPVSEATFFQDIAAMTYPEINDFFTKYVLGNNPLPYEPYFEKIGLKLERPESGLPILTRVKEMTPQQKKLYEAWSKNLPR